MRKMLFTLAFALFLTCPLDAVAATYFVRQTIGSDENDGLSPEKAWRSVSKLSTAMHAGDTAYVGPGLYREAIKIENDGTVEGRIVFIGDRTGQHTGDPAGAVVITGSEPMDETTFTALSAPGVFKVPFIAPYPCLGVVEMDGDQRRYLNVEVTMEYLNDKMPALDVVAKLPRSWYWDNKTQTLYIHTTDGKAPSTHEIELFHRNFGIIMTRKHFVTITGFTFRSMGDAGIGIYDGCENVIAVDNTSFGSRQGIRVHAASNILVAGNRLFRNENAGVYSLAESRNVSVVGNVVYENTKGIRWSSHSENALALDNVLFDNRERGISIEDIDHAILRRNRAVNNTMSQLFAYRVQYDAEENCYQNGAPDQLIADYYLFPAMGKYKTLAEYQEKTHMDSMSREGGCGPLPEKMDVRKLHADTMAYAEKARKILSEARAANPAAAPGGTNGAPAKGAPAPGASEPPKGPPEPPPAEPPEKIPKPEGKPDRP